LSSKCHKPVEKHWVSLQCQNLVKEFAFTITEDINSINSRSFQTRNIFHSRERVKHKKHNMGF